MSTPTRHRLDQWIEILQKNRKLKWTKSRRGGPEIGFSKYLNVVPIVYGRNRRQKGEASCPYGIRLPSPHACLRPSCLLDNAAQHRFIKIVADISIGLTSQDGFHGSEGFVALAVGRRNCNRAGVWCAISLKWNSLTGSWFNMPCFMNSWRLNLS